MTRLLSSLLMLFAIFGCKPSVNKTSDSQSITPRGQVAGKWLATLSIGGAVTKEATELLATTLKDHFLSESGGSYKLAFSLTDYSEWKPNKAEILKSFANLHSQISKFKKQNPNAPTMVVIGLTGHGFSQQMFTQAPAGYIFKVNHGNSESMIPGEYFTGSELAEIISSLGADEILMFVQSCMSGNLSNVEFMNKYAKELANESVRRKTNIAVITPVNEVILSPTYGIENIINKTFNRLAAMPGDVANYAEFKDQFVRAVCEDQRFYPRSEIKDLAAVQASADLMSVETLEGIDPQFYESIDPNLPIQLTNSGRKKYNSGQVTFPKKLPPASNIPVSETTKQFCAEQVAKRSQHFKSLEDLRNANLKLAQPCYKNNQNKAACLQDVVKKLYEPGPVSIPVQPNAEKSVTPMPIKMVTPVSIKTPNLQ